MNDRPPALGRRQSADQRKLKDLLDQRDNRVCADCGSRDPKWASANIGVFICLKCCGVHRSLGTHISKVLSVTLDEWSDAEIESMIEVGGNAAANAIYEAYIPAGVKKPRPSASPDERSNFISLPCQVFQFITTRRQKGILALLELLKVPTSVIQSNLNHAWNEELMLSVPQEFGLVKLQVYNYDMFTSEDLMGDAQINIQPMITSAMTFGYGETDDNMQIGKWLRSDDNTLAKDSIVNIVEGKVKHEVSLKLHNVECGEIDLDMEWIPLDQ